MTTDPTPDLCCTHGERIDRILDLLEGRKAKREPKDGAYRVKRSPAGEAMAYWQQKQIEAQRATGDADESLMPAVVERLAQATLEIRVPDLRHAATFQRSGNSDRVG